MNLKKQADNIMRDCIILFNDANVNFKLPIVWLSARFSHDKIAEWGNGYIENFGEFHQIKIDFKKITTSQDLYDTILHELIHAWQYENKHEVDHEILFLKWVVYFAELGYNTSSLECDLKTLIELQQGVKA